MSDRTIINVMRAAAERNEWLSLGPHTMRDLLAEIDRLNARVVEHEQSIELAKEVDRIVMEALK